MKFRYSFLCILFFLSNDHLFAVQNTRFHEIKTLTRQMLQDPVVKKTAIKINEIFNKQKIKEADIKETGFIKRTSCNFLLRVLIPAVLVCSITYLLLFYYKITPLSLGPDFSSWKLLFTDLGQILKSYKWKLIEVSVAFLRLYTIGKDTSSLFFDILRIASSSLFLVNKKQFSLTAFKQGAYYTSGWLLYDSFHLLKTLYDDSSDEEKKTAEQKDFKFKKLEEIFNFYALPLFEFGSVLLLALDSAETDRSIDTRNSIQALYSLIRIFSQYLKSKYFAVNTLLTLNIFVVGYNLWNDAAKNSGKTGKDGFFGVENFDDKKTEEREDVSEDQQDEDQKPEDKQDKDQKPEEGDKKEDCYLNESSEDDGGDMISEKDLDRIFYENPDSEKRINALLKEPEDTQDNMNFPTGCRVNGVLMNEIKKTIDDFIRKNPKFANLINKGNRLSTNVGGFEQADRRSLRVILEELLNRAEKIKQLENLKFGEFVKISEYLKQTFVV